MILKIVSLLLRSLYATALEVSYHTEEDESYYDEPNEDHPTDPIPLWKRSTCKVSFEFLFSRLYHCLIVLSMSALIIHRRYVQRLILSFMFTIEANPFPLR